MEPPSWATETYASVSTSGHFLRLAASCWAPAAVNLLYWTLGRETHPGAWLSGPSSPSPRSSPLSQQSDQSPVLPVMPERTPVSTALTATTHCPGFYTHSSTRRDTMSGSTCARLLAPTSQMQLLYKLPETEDRHGLGAGGPHSAGITAPLYRGQIEAQRDEATSPCSYSESRKQQD